jgi:hypothetical protein
MLFIIELDILPKKSGPVKRFKEFKEKVKYFVLIL